MKAVKPNVVEDPTPLVPPVLQFYDYYTLNRQSAFNRALIVETPECGCFHCGSRFPGSKVSKWLDEGDDSRLKGIFLVHGEPDAQSALKKYLLNDGWPSVETVKADQIYTLR